MKNAYLNYFKILIFFFVLQNQLLADFTCANPRSFEKVYSINTAGDIAIIGNSNLCQNVGGSCGDPEDKRNNNIDMMHINVDGDASTFNHSSAYLEIQNGSTILWAGLYWQGMFAGPTATQQENSKNVRLKLPDGSTQEITSDPAKFNWVYLQESPNRWMYQGVQEITALLQASPNGYYEVANIQTAEGTPAGGSFGGWSIVVIYQNDTLPIQNLTVFDGYQGVMPGGNGSSCSDRSGDPEKACDYADDNGCSIALADTGVANPISITLDGFLTPKEDTVVSSLALFSGEGDRNNNGDQLLISDKDSTTHNIFDDENPTNDIQNATISHFGEQVTTLEPQATLAGGTPWINTLGIDIDMFDISGLLSNSQTSTVITMNTDGDGYFPGVFAFATQLYVPNFCYDYAYSQQGQYFTEDNFGDQDPRLVGDVLQDEPVQMKLFVRNLVDSDIDVSNMFIDVTDINTSQADYISGSTKLAKTGDLIPQAVSEASINSDDSYIKDIEVGTMSSNDTFYLYYELNPLKTELNMPIVATLNYDLNIEGVAVNNYKTKLGSGIEMCSSSNFNYTPSYGIFNVVHNNFYDLDTGGSEQYYNLSTQITQREEDFKVISLDETNTDQLNPVSTIVAVEMIDVSAFHDTEASCMELNSSISDKIWVHLTDDTAVDLETVSKQFTILPGKARENAAFRVSYNLTNDGNDDLVKISEGKNPGQYKINFTELVQDLGECAKDMDGNLNSSDQVAQWCSNNSDKLTKEDIEVCMECVYGYNTRLVCSRDNFAIRPEALKLKIDDQNQDDPTIQATIVDESGKVTPNAGVINLASGYQYNLEGVAANHLNNNPSFGYTKSISNIDTDRSHYIWEPRTALTPNACNDEENVITPIRFVNGVADINTSADQVGEYRLNITDKTWTSVDHNPLYMVHHAGNYFKESVDINHRDCIVNSTASYPSNSASINGCDISSSHTNDQNTLEYIDYAVTFHPYRFNLETISPTTGINNDAITTTSFVYMSDISLDTDENMSVHLNGSIIAQGENNVTLSNFVDGCFAKPLDITLDRTNVTLPVAYQYRFKTFGAANTLLRDTNATDLNNSTLLTQTETMDFNKAMNGAMPTVMNLNYARSRDTAINPEAITFDSYEVDCSTVADCTFNADLINNKTTRGVRDLNTSTVRHYYGRSFSERQRYAGPQGDALIYYEAYCDIATGCDPTLLQGTDVSQDGDTRWRINPNHRSNHGSAGAITHKAATTRVAGTSSIRLSDANDGTVQDLTTLNYNESRGYPYKTTMEHNADGWLIYNKYNSNATTNEFEAEFTGTGGSWAGKHETDTTTTTGGASTINRRTMW